MCNGPWPQVVALLEPAASPRRRDEVTYCLLHLVPVMDDPLIELVCAKVAESDSYELARELALRRVRALGASWFIARL